MSHIQGAGSHLLRAIARLLKGGGVVSIVGLKNLGEESFTQANRKKSEGF